MRAAGKSKLDSCTCTCNSEAAISVYVRPLQQGTREIAPRTEIRATGFYLIRNLGETAGP